MAIKSLVNERTLLVKVAEGNERAFKELFDFYYNPLGEYVFRLTNSIAISEEIVQDTFIKIWLKRETLAELKSFSNYLFIVCRNQTYDQLRKVSHKHNMQKKIEQYFQQELETEPAEAPIDQYRILIDNAVDRLPPQAKKVYLFSRHERLKYDEIAILLNISPETVKKHIQYAVNSIKKDVYAKIDMGILLILISPLIRK
ncbi:RNA polymerase sigma factor [Mucilaginibacter sp.]|uniref:RNA polymerase sigma factor n=1 Tax=Mucilaginibacter sp. TaxID=1882438 RepID=UPI002608C53B|nr:RNA polymerase sigma-70 factor [Mucilaginibacter sp.]MDB4926029.1 polymerase sigma-70 factor [Mucilaginibacter sp.]